MASNIHIGHNTAGAGATQVNNVTNNIGRSCTCVVAFPTSIIDGD